MAEPPRPATEPPPSARMGLLDFVTSTSLDADYAHVAARRSSTGGPRRSRPGGVALVALAVFGVLVATAAVQTSRTSDESASSRESLVAQVNARKADLAQRRTLVRTLQRAISAQQTANLDATQRGRALSARIETLGMLSGTAAVRGPGVQVLVDDQPGTTSVEHQVQAPDLQKLVNGLWLVGAEAISVNGQRLTSLTPIRDAAGAITVNFVSLRRPYRISAIGNSKTMGARLLDTAGGRAWLTLQSTFGLKFDVNSKDTMVLPAAKPVTLRTAHRPGDSR
jgi:uncharacterized protein YlxW (UPF0749 family)